MLPPPGDVLGSESPCSGGRRLEDDDVVRMRNLVAGGGASSRQCFLHRAKSDRAQRIPRAPAAVDIVLHQHWTWVPAGLER